MKLAWILTLAVSLHAAERRDLFDETILIPRSQWRGIRVALSSRPATVRCRFTITEGQSSVRAVIMSAADTERFRKGESFRMLATTGAGRQGSLDFRIPRPGDYMLLIDNRTTGGEAVKLDLKAWLDFQEGDQFGPRELPSQTRSIVLGLSAVWMMVAGGWPGWRIWRAWRRRRDALRGFYPDRF